MPEGVIDLTAEEEEQAVLPTYTYTHNLQRQPARPIDLTDESDDIEYIGVNRIHLPARPYATGNDPRQPHFNRNVDIANPNAVPSRRRAILNNVVREAEAREGIFSRNAGNNGGPGPAAEAFAAAARWQQQQQPRRVQAHVPPPRADPHANARYQGIFNDVREYDIFAALEGPGDAAGAQGNNRGGGRGIRGFFNDWLRFPLLGGGGGGFFAMPANNGQPYVPIPQDAEAARKKKKYSVRQSHPGFTKANSKGFSRDVIPPPEYEPESEPEPEVQPKAEEAKKEEIQPTLSPSRKGKQKMQVVNISESPSGTDSPKLEVDDDETDEDKPLMSLIARTTSPKRLDKGKQKAIDQDNLDIPIFDLDSSSTSSSGISTQNSLDKPGSSSTSSTSVELLPSASTSKPTISSAALIKTDSSSSSDIEQITKPIPPPSPPKIKTRTVPCPVCASCAQPLYLNQPSKKRPYLLFCQHVVCHACLMAATKRCEEWSKRKKEGGWTGTPVEEFEELEPDSIPVPSYTSKGKNKAAAGNTSKGKGKRKREDEDEEDGEESLVEEALTGKKQRKTRKNASAKTRTSRSKRAAAAVANARDFAESSGEDDIVVPDDPSYRPPETDTEMQGGHPQLEQDDDEMNDGPRQPGTSYTTITSSPDKKALSKGKKGVKGKQATAAAKKKKADGADEIVVDENWLVCPIEACKGHKSDLLQPIGSKTGAWEMFV